MEMELKELSSGLQIGRYTHTQTHIQSTVIIFPDSTAVFAKITNAMTD